MFGMYKYLKLNTMFQYERFKDANYAYMSRIWVSFDN